MGYLSKIHHLRGRSWGTRVSWRRIVKGILVRALSCSRSYQHRRHWDGVCRGLVFWYGVMGTGGSGVNVALDMDLRPMELIPVGGLTLVSMLMTRSSEIRVVA